MIETIGTVGMWAGLLTMAVLIAQFLIQAGTWELSVPWQIRAFTRVFIVMVFLYLLTLMGTILAPETKVTIFTDSTKLIGDLLKMTIGAIIGALSTAFTGRVNADEHDEAPRNFVLGTKRGQKE
jgi:hypothetical protein